MIAFDLCCDQDHTFEVWFRDAQSYDTQKGQGLLECPVCGSREVKKILSPVAVRTHTQRTEGTSAETVLSTLLRRMYQTVVKDTEDVGVAFAQEALKMHYGVTEHRNIRGTATADEEKLLHDEGVEFIKIPVSVKKAREGH